MISNWICLRVSLEKQQKMSTKDIHRSRGELFCFTETTKIRAGNPESIEPYILNLVVRTDYLSCSLCRRKYRTQSSSGPRYCNQNRKLVIATKRLQILKIQQFWNQICVYRFGYFHSADISDPVVCSHACLWFWRDEGIMWVILAITRKVQGWRSNKKRTSVMFSQLRNYGSHKTSGSYYTSLELLLRTIIQFISNQKEKERGKTAWTGNTQRLEQQKARLLQQPPNKTTSHSQANVWWEGLLVPKVEAQVVERQQVIPSGEIPARAVHPVDTDGIHSTDGRWFGSHHTFLPETMWKVRWQ